MTRFLRNLLFEDVWLKLASLVAAVLIWLTVFASIEQENAKVDYSASALASHTFHDVPVLVVSSAADVRRFKVKPSHVEITVRGQTTALDSLKEKDLHVLVDLTSLGNTQAMILPVQVSTPPGVMLSRITPEAVEVLVPAGPAK